MKMKLFILSIAFFTTTIMFCQTSEKPIGTNTIEDQFDSLIKNSNRYQEYRVIETASINKLKSNILDSIVVSRKKVSEVNGTFNLQKTTIDSLTIALKNSKENLISLKNETESIGFIGVNFNKGVFKTMVFSIIVVLLILLLFFITKFKQSDSITVQAKQDLKVLEEEFELHRKTALEREQKVRRQLQDELNKQKKDN